MTRFRLTVEFDGRPYMGWQRQPQGPTIQAAIEAAAHAITGEPAVVHAAGRTDAGVHGEAMVAHIDISRVIKPFRLMEALNALLRPQPIAIIGCIAVADDWHARFSCIGRRYIYRITNRRAPLALDQGRAWHIKHPLDEAAMQDAARILIGHHDFTTFRSAHCQSASPIKSLDRLDVKRHGEDIEIEAAARSFLHHQVRSMVGCLALVGHDKWRKADLQAALDAKDRTALGFNAPPDGLYFMEARYPEDGAEVSQISG
jgi:tRNA pseudouridine38-40 synthase